MVKPNIHVLVVALGACGGGGGGTPEIDALPPVVVDGGTCEAPDVLVLLDRTASMAERPNGTKPPNTAAGHTETKWFTAIAAVESLTAKFELTVRFGLGLFPRVQSSCVTLSQYLGGQKPTNPQCQAGELLVPPAMSMSTMIGSELDPELTRLCTSTPIGGGLATARTELAAIRTPNRPQYVLFVGDGADTCDPQLALANTDALAADGVNTFVVAFDQGAPAGIDKGLLNDMACAGRTAPGFPAGCTADAAGNYRATDRTGAALFMNAGDAASLQQAFEQVAGSVCCGCLE